MKTEGAADNDLARKLVRVARLCNHVGLDSSTPQGGRWFGRARAYMLLARAVREDRGILHANGGIKTRVRKLANFDRIYGR